MTTLETARLRLRPWRVSDAVVHRQMWAERDPRVPARRRVTADGHPTVAELEKWVGAYEPVPEPGPLVVELPSSGSVLGYCGLVPNSVGRPDEPELAFEFLREHHGLGYATEAATAVIVHATAVGYGHLAATVREWNTASLRVLDKLGFVDTGEREPDAVHGDSLLLRKTL